MIDTLLIVYVAGPMAAIVTTTVYRLIVMMSSLAIAYSSLGFMLMVDYVPAVEILSIIGFCLAAVSLVVEIVVTFGSSPTKQDNPNPST